MTGFSACNSAKELTTAPHAERGTKVCDSSARRRIGASVELARASQPSTIQHAALISLALAYPLYSHTPGTCAHVALAHRNPRHMSRSTDVSYHPGNPAARGSKGGAHQITK